MPLSNKKSFVAILLFWTLSFCYSQDFKFHQLSQNYILDNQSILTIDQDREGRLWFGGKEKLFVYDSQSVKNIFENDTLFINGEYLNKIAIDEYNNILLGTAYHFLIYNINERRYINGKDKSLINAQINDIALWQGKIFVASSKGLYALQFDPPQKTYKVTQKINSLNTKTLYITPNGTLFYASKSQVYRYNAVTGPTILTLPIKDDFITAIHCRGEETWVGTHRNGIFIYKDQQLIKILNESNSILLSNNIRKIKEIDDLILVGTLKGLCSINRQLAITNFSHQINTPWTISQNSIYDIYQDNQKTIWIGTYFGGVDAIYPNPTPIITLTSKPTSTFQLQSDIISSITEDQHYLYIGTEETGLQVINKTTGRTLNPTTPSNLVKSLLLLGNQLYIGQHNGGLSIYNVTLDKLQNGILSQKYLARANNINEIAHVGANILLGTDNGIYELRGNEEYFYEETQGNTINKIAKLKSGGVFTIIRGELWFKAQGKDKFEPMKLDIDHVNNITTDTDNNLWISTNHQIYLLQHAALKQIYQNTTLKLGNICKIDKQLWIGSNKGLLRYDLDDKQLHILTLEDGLTTNSLQQAQLYVNAAGELYITSLKGLNRLNPKNISFNTVPPTVLLSRFTVFDKERLLERDSQSGYHIDLPYDQNYFNIEFASSNFIKPQKNMYRYKLEGVDKDWKLTTYPVARYMNLSPGRYTLSIMASNNDGVWSKNPLQIDIHITPPFWKTWWAYLGYLCALALLTHFTIRFIVERQLLLNAEKEHEKKIKFFTQISHEIRTPLTLITVPLQELVLATEATPLIQSKIKRLQSNANKLLTIVNELLDFKKLDDGKAKLLLKPIHLKPYLEEFFYLFSDLAVAKNLNFYIKQIDDIGSLPIDSKQFDKAIFNLLSNAIKYCYDNGTVFLEAVVEEKNYCIRIADNGIGISENNQFKIFEEYYRDPKAQEIIGTGIGLALTKTIVEQHKGSIDCKTVKIEGQPFTIFTISFPLKQFVRTEALSMSVDRGHEETIRPTDLALDKEVLLLVEDNKELSETVAKLFRNHYTVIIAGDGEEGLEKATRHMPDIIVSDVMMPKMDGLEMSEKIKTNVVTAHIPIILLTADTNEASQLKGLQYGANIYLQKPFNSQMLLFTVKNLLEIAKKRRIEFNLQQPVTLSAIDQSFIEKLEHTINQNLHNENFGVDFLARELGMSQPILYKKLKSVTNLSVNNFIKQYRLKKAVELLKSEKNISEVAYAVGFSDRKYFSKEFKKHFGKNPSEFLAGNSNSESKQD